MDRVKQVAGVTDVTTDREQGGLQANVSIDRAAAARLGVRIQDIDNALNDAFSQRQISTIYRQRNQYRVILEVDRKYQRDPSDLTHVYVAGNGNTQVPLSEVAHVERGIAPLVVNHQGQFPSVTITYNIVPNVTIEDVTAGIEQAVAEMHIPDTIHADFAGDVQAFKQSVGAQPLLLLAALVAVYIVLGVLYESLAHPLTIISTLPSAGLGALLALQLFNTELTVIAFIGIILLIGIVKKNGIMMVDFALDGERRRGLVAARGHSRSLPGAFPADPDDHHGGGARRAAAGDRDRPRLRAAPAARHHHHRRAVGVAGAHALHHAGDLSAARPAAPQARRPQLHLHQTRPRHPAGGVDFPVVPGERSETGTHSRISPAVSDQASLPRVIERFSAGWQPNATSAVTAVAQDGGKGVAWLI